MSENNIMNRNIKDIVIGKFTKKEIVILDLIALGLSNNAIAHKLKLAKTTIDTHTNHILQKLNIEDRSTSALRVKVAIFWLRHKENVLKL